MSQPNLTNPDRLASKFNLANKLVLRLLSEAKVEPLYQTPYGRGTMRFYEEAPAEAVLAAYIKAQREKVKPASADPLPPAGFSFAGIEARMQALELTILAQSEEIAEARAETKKAVEQGAHLFKRLGELITQVQRIADELGVKVQP